MFIKRIKETSKHATETVRNSTNTSFIQECEYRKKQQVSKTINNQEKNYHECHREQTPTTQAQVLQSSRTYDNNIADNQEPPYV